MKLLIGNDSLFAIYEKENHLDITLYGESTYKLEYHDKLGRRISYFDPHLSNRIQKAIIDIYDKLASSKLSQPTKPFDITQIRNRSEFEIRIYWFDCTKVKTDIKFSSPDNNE